ncbi:DUF3566 domain-containing protein [Actinocorallia sp. API 0066]|uniref:DUF3566 domain-containing protein n=1 Tax=Actinocorallia sp. API 0066 TaxID=2896846 RepID=UPI001E4A039D|nr:DUF3566 domain-containing protein [Actinocorallia sp. API 0066]MCD0452451.1 DUF3566 domain-containing protein [Actinocorallia sp. API 0066]
MSTTSKNENKAAGPPDGGSAGASPADPVKSSANDTQVDLVKDDARATVAEAAAGRPDKATANGEVDAGETVVDPPWAAAAEPSNSVFADRPAAPSFSPAAPPAPPAAPPSVPAGQPATDRPVASAAASAAQALSARLRSAAQSSHGGGGGEGGEGGKNPRRAHLQVSRFEPWSVMKFSFVMSLVCFVVLFVAVTVLYMILAGLGVFDSITEAINETTRSPGTGGTDAGSWFSAGRILGYTALIGALNVLLITALATVGSVIYNLAADFVGGVEVTLKEAE